MKEKLNLSDTFLYIVIALFGFAIMILGAIGIAEYCNRNNQKDEQIKILEQSLQEQIQEKQVYINLLGQKEETNNG